MAVHRLARHKAALLALSLLLALAACSAPAAAPLDATLSAISADYGFSTLAWEADQVRDALRAALGGRPAADDEIPLRYLEVTRALAILTSEMRRQAASGEAAGLGENIREWEALRERQVALERETARVLGAQIRKAAAELGIRTPLDRFVSLPVTFPPVWFVIDEPPHILVVSPRERIESLREVLLVEDLDVFAMQALEDEVDALGYSSLVTAIGGYGGLYPALVANSTSLAWLVETATEEWLHQYLAFTPLGFRYVLDLLQIAPDYDVATLNETVAGLASEEIARQVLLEHYPDHVPSPRTDDVEPEPGAFSFNAEMRETRLRVDALLAEGRVAEAEEYMEQRRLVFLANGYALRKLNQAYFAFHGAYALEEAAVDPIGEQVRLLRAQSPDLRGFLARAATLRGRADLAEAVGATP